MAGASWADGKAWTELNCGERPLGAGCQDSDAPEQLDARAYAWEPRVSRHVAVAVGERCPSQGR